MNLKRFLLSLLAAFLTIWITDFLIHSVWLSATYGETKELWRPETELMGMMPWMFLGQFLVALAVVLILTVGVTGRRSLMTTLVMAVGLGLFYSGGQFIMYSVQPFPVSLVVKWVVAGTVQMLLVGGIVHAIYRPKPN